MQIQSIAKTFRNAFAVIVFLEIFSSTALAFEGTVVGVSDGDTITVLNVNKPEKIRLANIDCPEKMQAFGAQAKKFCSSLCYGKQVSVQGEKRDRNKRLIATVLLPDGKILNEEILKAGFAWCYKQYCDDQKLFQLENEARNAKVGLWVDNYPVAPWTFRVNEAQKRAILKRLPLK